jgi:hypothetical protein
MRVPLTTLVVASPSDLAPSALCPLYDAGIGAVVVVSSEPFRYMFNVPVEFNVKAICVHVLRETSLADGFQSDPEYQAHLFELAPVLIPTPYPGKGDTEE